MRFITLLFNRLYTCLPYSHRSIPMPFKNFIAATLFMIVIAILNASVPYLVRETMNTLTHQYQVNFVIYSLLFSGAYGLCCTSAQVFEWLKTILSSSMLAKCDAAFQRSYYLHLMRVDYKNIPPDASIRWPFTQPLCSLNNMTTIAPMSSGMPTRPKAVF